MKNSWLPVLCSAPTACFLCTLTWKCQCWCRNEKEEASPPTHPFKLSSVLTSTAIVCFSFNHIQKKEKEKKKSSKHSNFSSWGLWFKYPWSDNFQKDKPWVVWEQITWHSNVVSFRSREGTGRILFFYKKVVGYWAIFEEGICGLSLPPTPSPNWDNLLSHSHAFCYVPMWSRAGGNSGPPHRWERVQLVFVQQVFLLGSLTCFHGKKIWGREDSFSLMAEVTYGIMKWQTDRNAMFTVIYS